MHVMVMTPLEGFRWMCRHGALGRHRCWHGWMDVLARGIMDVHGDGIMDVYVLVPGAR